MILRELPQKLQNYTLYPVPTVNFNIWASFLSWHHKITASLQYVLLGFVMNLSMLFDFERPSINITKIQLLSSMYNQILWGL